jgi:acyl dehydratase
MADRCPESPYSLGVLLARGALLSPFKRPHPDADFPRTRLRRPGLRVDACRLAAYERVCGFDTTGDGALPITYPHVLGFPLAMRLMSARSFPLPLLGLVHTSIDITRHRSLSATGVYELTVYVDSLSPHRRGTEAAVVTEVREGEAVVWESTSRYLARHGTRGEGRRPEPDADAGAGADADADAVSLPVVDEWRLAADIGRRYAAVSGDRNPIHLHPLTARLFGFPRAIAHGMWTAARSLAAHGTPPAVRVHVDFRAPVLLPATVTFAANGTRFELREGGGEEGRVHVRGRVDPLGSQVF